MTTIDELRRSFEESAGQASTGEGMAERAQASATRIRRRRRIAATVAAACLVLVVAVAVPVAALRLNADGVTPSAVIPYRGPGQLTVRPAPDSTYQWRRGTDGTLQWMMPYKKSGCCPAAVRVYDPGTYDSKALTRGESITVSGHPAFWSKTKVDEPDRPDLGPSGPPTRNPAETRDRATVGWQDASGAWVTVVDTDAGSGPAPLRLSPAKTKALLLDIAADVRLGAPQDVLVPFHFPAVPRNLPITYADVDEETTGNSGTRAVLRFGGPPTPTTGVDGTAGGANPSLNRPLQITAYTGNGSAPWFEFLYGPVNTTVNGRPARYYDKDGDGSITVPKGESVLLVEIGNCGIQVNVQNPAQITRADLETMFKGATVDKCDTTKTWTRPFQ